MKERKLSRDDLIKTFRLDADTADYIISKRDYVPESKDREYTWVFRATERVAAEISSEYKIRINKQYKKNKRTK